MSTLTRAQACSVIAAAATSLFLPHRAEAIESTSLQDAPRVELGNDRFIASAWATLRAKRLGLVTNHTGLLSTGESLIDAIKRNPALDLRALYAPEHGLRGTHAAGTTVASSRDEKTGLPIYSLYGKHKRPSAAMLADVDVLLFDIQDVGARTYTYISTLAMVMQAAAAEGKSVWVLDRPNPIGGTWIEGPVLDPKFSSFIGLYPMPMRHGMTIGEIARLYRRSFGIDCDLEVVTMRNYGRTMLWSDTGLPWVPTSPHIPHFSTALVYLATGPLGGGGLDNGVGSSLQFDIAVAPALDGTALAAALNARKLEGVTFTPIAWRPQTGYYSSKTLTGVKLDVTQAHRFHSVRTAIEILAAVRTISPRTLHFDEGFDRDWGTDSLRIMLQKNISVEAMLRQWRPRMDVFLAQRQDALLYT